MHVIAKPSYGPAVCSDGTIPKVSEQTAMPVTTRSLYTVFLKVWYLRVGSFGFHGSGEICEKDFKLGMGSCIHDGKRESIFKNRFYVYRKTETVWLY